jgi:ferredoxin
MNTDAPKIGVSASDPRVVIPVRFTNTPSGDDVVVDARPGEVLLNVADRGGVAVARGCKTGLCGACTCDLKDPSWTAAAHLVADTVDGGREGFQTVRACSTRVTLLKGQSEFVIDVYRSSRSGSGRKGSEGGVLGATFAEDDPDAELPPDPMARFSEDWETEFVPDYKKYAEDETSGAHLPSVANGVAPWDQIW